MKSPIKKGNERNPALNKDIKGLGAHLLRLTIGKPTPLWNIARNVGPLYVRLRSIGHGSLKILPR